MAFLPTNSKIVGHFYSFVLMCAHEGVFSTSEGGIEAEFWMGIVIRFKTTIYVDEQRNLSK